MNSTFKAVSISAFVMTSVVAADITAARAEYPEKPIKVIVGFRAGGATDTLIKLFTEPLSKVLGQPVITTNITGGGGSVGTAQASRAKPDGYTLVVGSNGTMTVSPQARKTGYTHQNFIALGQLAAVPLGVAVRADGPHKTLKDLVAQLKKNPGTKYTSVGTGSSVHLASAIWADAAGVKLVHVGNRGGRGAIVKLLSKEVDFIWVSATNIPPQLKKGKQGKLHPIAVTSSGRWKYAPSVPTLMDSGYDLTATSWWGLFTPKDTPRAVVAKLRGAIKQVATSGQMEQTLKKFYFTPSYASPDQVQMTIKNDLVVNKKALVSIGLMKKKK